MDGTPFGAMQEAQKRAMVLRALRQEQMAQAAAGRGLMPQQQPIPGAQPMAPGVAPAMPPGQGSVPGGMSAGGGPPSPRGGFPMPALPQGGGAAPPPQAASPGGGAMGQPPMGRMTVQQLAQAIKARNPGIDDATLFQAVEKTQALLAPEGKLELESIKIEMRIKEMDAKLRQGEDRIALQREALETREKIVQLQQAGMDRRQSGKLEAAMTMLMERLASNESIAKGKKETAERGQDLVHEDKGKALTEKAREADQSNATRQRGQDTRATNAVGRGEYNTSATQLRQANAQISDLIRENGGMVPAPTAKKYAQYQQLKARRDAIFDRMIEARKKDQTLPPPSKAAAGDEGEKPAAETAAKPEGAAAGTRESPITPKSQKEIDSAKPGTFFLIDGKLMQK